MSETKRLYTPAEVAAELHPAISEYDIRRRARNGTLEYTEGSKRRVLLTRPQIEALLDSMTKPAQTKQAEPTPALAVVPEEPNVFGATTRSHKRTQRSRVVSA